jgi:hypothetical protein
MIATLARGFPWTAFCSDRARVLEDAMSNFLHKLRPNLLSGLLAAGALGALALGSAPLQATPLVAPSAGIAVSGNAVSGENLIEQVQYRDRRAYRSGRDYRRGHHRDRLVGRHYGPRPVYRHHRYDPGAAAVAGIFGLATGAIIAGALAPAPLYPVAPHRVLPHRVVPHYSRSDLAYCSRKYRSFDPVSFTYLGYDGRRHYCRIP